MRFQFFNFLLNFNILQIMLLVFCYFFSWAMLSDQVFLIEILGRYLRPGLLRARFARLLLRNELNPAYPYRIFLVELFLVRCFVISFFIWIIWARPFGSGFCGFRCASEHPADGSPSGPANPSRVFFKILCLEIGIDGFGVKKHVAS